MLRVRVLGESGARGERGGRSRCPSRRVALAARTAGGRAADAPARAARRRGSGRTCSTRARAPASAARCRRCVASLGCGADRYLITTGRRFALARPGSGVDRPGGVRRPRRGGQARGRTRALPRGDCSRASTTNGCTSDATSTETASPVPWSGWPATRKRAVSVEAAVASTRRQVALDPLAEEPHRELIRRLAVDGDRPGGARRVQRLQDRLRRELGIVPSAGPANWSRRSRAAKRPGTRSAGAVRQPASPAPPRDRHRHAAVHRPSELDRDASATRRRGGERLRRAHFGCCARSAVMPTAARRSRTSATG